MTIRVVALDLGMVVLFFSHQLACCRLSRLGGGKLPASELYRRLFECGLNGAMDLGMPLCRIVDELQGASELAAQPEQLINAFSDIFWANSDVCDVLPFIPRHIKLVLASNTNAAHASFFRREFAHILSCCDTEVLSCEVAASKPSSEFYARLVSAASCNPGEILFLDDRADNVCGATDCGLVATRYTESTRFRAVLDEHGVVLPVERQR